MPTHKRRFTDACILDLSVETTGLKGGDGGHGGATNVQLKIHGGDLEGNVADGLIQIQVRGDAELRTLKAALRDAADFLDSVVPEQ